MPAPTTAPKLALHGGPKTVTESLPPWPAFNEAEIAEAHATMTRSRESFSEACSALKGGITDKLEAKLAEWLGRRHILSTCGGGPALHIACLAAGVQLGDEVITTPYSWGQTVSCILQAGGIPIFADIDPERLTLDPASIEARITPRTKAIVLVHIYGQPADMKAIMALADKHDLVVIEDCAQAQGSREDGQYVGTLGHMSCFSIGSGKNLAAGDGGFLATDDDQLFQRCVLAGMHPGRAKRDITDEALKQQVDSLIYTYRISTFTAAIAYRQLDRLEELNTWRRRNMAALREQLADLPGIRPQALPADVDPAYHLCPWTFVADEVPGVARRQFMDALRAEGVPISGSYVGTPIHLRPIFQNKEWWLGNGYPWAAHPAGDSISYATGDCPVAEQRCAELDLMMGGSAWYQDLTPMVEQIGEAFRKVTAQLDQLG